MHSLMHVDGLAQALKAPSVTIMKADDAPTSFIAAADLTYAYNVQWARAWQGPSGGSTTNVEYDANGNASTKKYYFTVAEDCSPWDLGWPMEDDASEIGFNRSMTLNGYPDLAFGGMFQWKRNYRKEALAHMVRSTATVRSARNEVGFGMLVDSVDAQRGAHTFESYLILHADVAVDESASACSGNGCKITIRSAGTAQLDVHVRTMGRQVSYRVESFGSHKRLVVKSGGEVREEFWMAFHPHEGDVNGFEMRRDASGEVSFMYEGEKREFGVDKDHTVVEL